MVTEKKFTDLGNSQASLTLTIDAASIEKAYSEKLTKYAKEIEMPGFRKGHTPLSVVERKIGDQVREEVTFDLMESSLKETIETLDKKERPISYCVPELQDEEKLLPFKKDSDVTYTVKYDIFPIFDLPEYKGLEVEFADKSVTDEDVEKEIENLRDQNAIVVNKTTPAEDGDIATVDYTVSVDGEEKSDYSRKDFSLTLGKTYNLFKIDSDIIGMNAGDSKEVEKTYGEEDAPEEEFKNKSVKISITLTKLKKRELPEVDDDFAQDVKEEYKTVADLKAGVRKDLEEKAEEYRKNVKGDAVVKALMEKVSFTVPETMVTTVLDNQWDTFVRQTFGDEKTLLEMLKHNGQTKEGLLASWKDGAAEDAKREVLLSAIADKEDFEVTEDEIIEALGGKDAYEKIDEKNRDTYKEYVKEDLKYQKVVPFLVENNSFKAVEKKAEEE